MIAVINKVMIDIGSWKLIIEIHGGGVFFMLSWNKNEESSHQVCLSWNEIQPLIDLLNQRNPNEK